MVSQQTRSILIADPASRKNMVKRPLRIFAMDNPDLGELAR